MKMVLPAIIYTHDEALLRHLSAYLDGVAQTRNIENPAELMGQLDRNSAMVIVFDLCGQSSLEILPRLRERYPESLIIAIGDRRSDPGIMADELGVFAIEDSSRPENIACNVRNAFEMIRITQENAWLRREKSRLEHVSNAEQEREKGKTKEIPDRIFSRPIHKFKDVDSLAERIIEELMASARVSRAGIFIQDPITGIYRFQSGMHCLEGSRQIEMDPDSPLALWLKANNHIVAHQTLEHITDHEARIMLSEVLGQLGAEALIPLHTEDRNLGLLFVGPRSVGLPFRLPELEGLGTLAEQISTTIENALLYEQVALQRAMAETLLNAVPYAFIASGTDGKIRWINRTARNMLALGDMNLYGMPVEELGPQIADAMRRALDHEELLKPEKMDSPQSVCTLSIETRSLQDNSGCIGALAIVKDVEEPYLLREQQQQIERSEFWTKLAAAMSHEIHNPLVTIKTYAQLMPERYQDDEFRQDFSKQLLAEVDHLSGVVAQISHFANPPRVAFKPMKLKNAILAGIDSANAKYPKVLVKVDMEPDDIPPIKGDEELLRECFAHITQNAIESRKEDWETHLRIELKTITGRNGDKFVEVSVIDAGKGIAPDILANVFSPFCTTKARGMGLGLPLSRRIIEDHGGTLQVDAVANQTKVVIRLPIDAGNQANGCKLDPNDGS